jgi:hypothetical protein
MIPQTKPSPDTLKAIYGGISDYKSPQGELFDLTQEDIQQIVKLLFEMPYTHKTCESLLQETQAIAMKTSVADKKMEVQLLDIATQLPYLKSTISALLNPEFHINFLQNRRTQNHTEKEALTLFEIISGSPQWVQAEAEVVIPQSKTLAKGVKAALTESMNQDEQVASYEKPSMERAQELWHEFIDKLGRTKGEYVHEDDTDGIRAIQDILHSKIKDIVAGEKKPFDILFETSERAFEWLENTKAWNNFRRIIWREFIQNLELEYNVKLGFCYRYATDATSKTKPKQQTIPLPMKQYSNLSIKETPGNFLAKIYKDYSIWPIPVINAKEHFTTYAGQDANKIEWLVREIVKPRDGFPALCVSPEYNTSFVFAALNQITERYRKERDEKKISRTVSASDLIRLNQLWGQMYAKAQEKGLPIPPNPFLKLSDYADNIVITWAEKLLAGDGIWTFAGLFSEHFRCHVILVSSTWDTSRLPKVREDPKKKRPNIDMQYLWFHTINIPPPADTVVLGQMKAYLQKNIANTLYGESTKINFSDNFYNAIKTIAQWDYTYLKQILNKVASLSAEHTWAQTNESEQNIFTELYMHCKQGRLFKLPLPMTFDDVFQIITAYLVNYIQHAHPANEYKTVGDFIVNDTIAKYISYFYLAPHNGTAPLQWYWAKQLVEMLSTHGLRYTQTNLKDYKSQSLQGHESAMFKDLCAVIDKQTINKLLIGEIDKTISPVITDPLTAL